MIKAVASHTFRFNSARLELAFMLFSGDHFDDLPCVEFVPGQRITKRRGAPGTCFGSLWLPRCFGSAYDPPLRVQGRRSPESRSCEVLAGAAPHTVIQGPKRTGGETTWFRESIAENSQKYQVQALSVVSTPLNKPTTPNPQKT